MMLQIFFYVNIFLAGAAIALAGWFAYAHFTAKKHDDHPQPHPQPQSALPKAARERILHRAEHKFQLILDHAAGELQYDLKATSDSLSNRLKSIGDQIIETEMQRYKASLEELRQQTETTIGNASAEVAKHQAELQEALKVRLKELEDALAKDVTAEKQHVVELMDKKIAGAMTAFLVETLGHNVDLGAQTQYLTETLEAHKAELIKELTDDNS